MGADQNQSAQSDGEIPGDGRVCVVATRSETFMRCRDGLYPAPRSYPRTRRDFDFMAFYRTAPVSAITHYAPVLDRIQQTRGKSGPLTETDWKSLIEPFSSESVVVVFELGDLVRLEDPIENDANGVRGAWYCTVEDLRTTGRLSALAERVDHA